MRLSPLHLPFPAVLLLLATACAEPEGAGEPPPPVDPAADSAQEAALAAPAPDTDIWVADLQAGASGLPVLGPARNVTERAGYDNQPHWMDDATILFTMEEDGDTDIWRVDAATGERSPFTRTSPESEYSAHLLPEADGISVIRVEADSTQRLWEVGMDGDPVAPVFPDVAPVGYHAWLDADHALLFVLGAPATLHLGTRGESGSRLLASDIGRSIRTVPGTRSASYTRNLAGDSTEIRVWDLDSGEERRLVEGIEGGDYHAWTPDGVLLQGHENRLYAFDPASGGGWEEIGALEAGLTISRLAVSPDGTRLALVVEAPATS